MRIAAVLSLVILAGCATGCATGPSRQDVLAGLVGRPESEALRVLGAPNHVLDANGRRFLAYEDEGVTYAPVAPFGPFGYGFYGPAAIPVPRACVTTLEIAAGRVAGWTLRGNGC